MLCLISPFDPIWLLALSLSLVSVSLSQPQVPGKLIWCYECASVELDDTEEGQVEANLCRDPTATGKYEKARTCDLGHKGCYKFYAETDLYGVIMGRGCFRDENPRTGCFDLKSPILSLTDSSFLSCTEPHIEEFVNISNINVVKIFACVCNDYGGCNDEPGNFIDAWSPGRNDHILAEAILPFRPNFQLNICSSIVALILFYNS